MYKWIKEVKSCCKIKTRENDSKYIEFKNKINKNNANSKILNRTRLLNILINLFERETKYLEIGVRDPNHNFNKINSQQKVSVDPGVEFRENPVDFKLTSDEFFAQLKTHNYQDKFDVIFIDGLHDAYQVDKDINNSIKHLKTDGIIVLHDCNPVVESLQRDDYNNFLTESEGLWNGTVWKSFINFRKKSELLTFCVDTDFGLGIIANKKNIFFSNLDIPPKSENNIIYYNYSDLARDRIRLLGLVGVNDFLKICQKQKL